MSALYRLREGPASGILSNPAAWGAGVILIFIPTRFSHFLSGTYVASIKQFFSCVYSAPQNSFKSRILSLEVLSCDSQVYGGQKPYQKSVKVGAKKAS